MMADFGLSRRATTYPAVCYDDCENAYTIFLNGGKTEETCAANSSFMRAYNGCLDCWSDNVDGVVGEDSLPPQFQQIIAYCNGVNGVSTTALAYTTITGAFTGTDSKVQTLTYVVAVSSAAESAVTKTASFEELTTITSASKEMTITVTAPPQSSRTSSTSSEPTTTQTSPSESASPQPGGKSNAGLIAGIVIGVLLGLTLLAAIAFLLKRRRKKLAQRGTEDGGGGGWMFAKAELHAESVPPKKPDEIDGHVICELAGSMPPPPEVSLHEVPANEVPATEMSCTDGATPVDDESLRGSGSVDCTRLTDEVTGTNVVTSTNEAMTVKGVTYTKVATSTNEVTTVEKKLPPTDEPPQT